MRRPLTEGEVEIDVIVAVHHPGPGEQPRTVLVVSPCGICREMIAEYGPAARVLVPAGDGVEPLPIGKLLPWKFCAPLRDDA